ncbi:MAG: RDD family protein [Gemmatimonadetes bacterium]|nr:RDD family protein [Gemmatimonadota bacterium]
MPVTAGARDPRSIITPDAFDVSPDLLGRPLARPRQRLAAIVIDLLVISLITLATRSFGMLLGIVAAIFFVRAGFKRTPVRGSAFNRAMRLSVGCLGVVIALVTAATWAIVRSASGGRDSLPATLSSRARSFAGVASALGGTVALDNAASADQARAAVGGIVTTLRGLKMPDADIRQAVLELLPKDKSWSSDAEAIVDEAMQVPSSEAPNERSAPAEADSGIADLSTEDALSAYADLRRSGAHDAVTTARLDALHTRLVGELAGDTLQVLERNLGIEKQVVEAREADVTRLTEELAQEKEGGGLISWLGDAANGLGFGFGWATIYLTIVLSWWKGQTVGKRLMKIRVLRLDGEPITWWTAFERAGGYAAGFATGFLGFAQVIWDANRQAIHDRIVGTVVVQDGAPRVLDWQDAL